MVSRRLARLAFSYADNDIPAASVVECLALNQNKVGFALALHRVTGLVIDYNHLLLAGSLEQRNGICS